MYRITVINSHIFKVGPRYYFRKKNAKALVNLLMETKGEFMVERLGHIGDTFFWCDSNDTDKVFRYFE